MSRRKAIRQAVITALATALDEICVVEARTAYSVVDTPLVRVSTPSDSAAEAGLHTLDIEVRVYVKAAASALDQLDDIADVVEPTVMRLATMIEGLTDVGEPTVVMDDDDGLEQNAAVLVITFPAEYTAA